MSLIKNYMETNSDLSEEEAKEEAIQAVKDNFAGEASPLKRWEKM